MVVTGGEEEGQEDWEEELDVVGQGSKEEAELAVREEVGSGVTKGSGPLVKIGPRGQEVPGSALRGEGEGLDSQSQ